MSCPEVQVATFPVGQETEQEPHAAVAGAVHDVSSPDENGEPGIASGLRTHEQIDVAIHNMRAKAAKARIPITPLA